MCSLMIVWGKRDSYMCKKYKAGFTLLEQAMTIAFILVFFGVIQTCLTQIHRITKDNYTNSRMNFVNFGYSQKYKYYTSSMLPINVNNNDSSTSNITDTEIITTLGSVQVITEFKHK